MCIIAYKPAGTPFPTKKQFKAMFENNSDGCGFMYADGGKVHIVKGLMEFSEFKREFQTIRARVDLPVVFHFRIATHGGVNKAMTQPFPLTAKTKKLKALRTSADVGIAHNGIIPLTCDARDISDTALFIKHYATRIFHDGIDARALDICEACIDSKMVILEGNGSAHILGAKWETVNGVHYSNSSYKTRQYYYTGKGKNVKWYYSADDGADGFDLTFSCCDGECDYCRNHDYCFSSHAYDDDSETDAARYPSLYDWEV